MESSSVVPGRHRVHPVAPAAENSPLAQELQAVIPRTAPNVPALQLEQDTFARASGCTRPASHATHGVEALASWSGEPAGQSVHAVARAGE